VNNQTIHIRILGCQPYIDVWQRMQHFTSSRTSDSEDQLWIAMHPATFTQGQAGDACHLGDLGNIPLVQTDRGGQVTYHGEGQLIFYTLIDLNRKKIGVKAFVQHLENISQQLLLSYGIDAQFKEGAPGLYVKGQKIASLGLKIKRGCSYHGLSININMNLEPFSRITPCGLTGMTVTQWTAHTSAPSYEHLAQAWIQLFSDTLGYSAKVTHPQESSWHCPTSP
jgi:lipoyl(octanoyl) transferase